LRTDFGLGQMSLPKQVIREKIWQALTAKKVTRFPGAHGRIPNFTGAETAARQLTRLDVWQTARTIKCNPDSPQRYVRYAALKVGKLVYQAVPRLRANHPFIELDPTKLEQSGLWRASSIRGAFATGKPVSLEKMPSIDLIVTGSVAVCGDGTRLGKGGGYSDIEYALCREAGLTDEKTPIVTTVHSLQVVPGGEIQMRAHDISLNWFATPEEIVETHCVYPQPSGILWDQLGEKLEEIPVLQDLARRARK
jgi:5-formyltetrahydrofolate cyclo-ligase